MKSYVFSLFVTLFTLTSCQIGGLTAGYSHLPKMVKERVVHYDGKIADISNNPYIYTVTVEQVKEYLTTHDRVLIYQYTPFCTSPRCISPIALADMCKAQGVDMLVISNTYDDIYRGMNKRFPILMIETNAFKTKWRWKYCDQFYYPLIGCSLKEIGYASYLYFKKGHFVRGIDDPKDIEKIEG